jgi:hypothetical protein
LFGTDLTGQEKMSNLKEKIKAAQIDLIKELGIDKLEQEQKEKIITDIGEIIQQRIVMRVVEELPEDKQDEFQGLLEKAQDNPEALDEFIKENIPGIEDMILEEIGEYKQGALGMLGKSQTEQSANEEEVVEKDESVASPAENVKDETLNKSTTSNQTVYGTEEVTENENKPVENMTDKMENEPALASTSADEKAVADEKASASVSPSSEATEVKETMADKTGDEEALSGIEQEQIQNEEAILEENKVDHKKTEGEELDLTEELDKMVENDNQEEDKK